MSKSLETHIFVSINRFSVSKLGRGYVSFFSTLDAGFEGVRSYLGMRMITKRIICSALLVGMLSGCNGIDNPEGDLKGIKMEEWPLTDCSTSTRPVRDLVAYKLLGVPYKWELD